MQRDSMASEPDDLLLPFLQTMNEAEAQRYLGTLLDAHARPVIQSTLARRWHVSSSRGANRQQKKDEIEAEEIQGEVIVQLAIRLRDSKSPAAGEPIGDFRAYVAVTTHRACDAYLRRKYPQRQRVSNRLRYVLTHQPGMALWERDAGVRYGGFAVWQNETSWPRHSSRLEQLKSHPQQFAASHLSSSNVACMNPAELLSAIFQWVGHPIALSELVTVACDLWNIHDPADADGSDAADAQIPYAEMPDTQTDIEQEVQQRDYLQHLWNEIRQLPPRQCAALLLNLRDTRGRGILALFPLLGIASMTEIGTALGMSPERFAGIWNELPIEDAIIADQLGITRQQVINLRKVARERLARRSRIFDGVL